MKKLLIHRNETILSNGSYFPIAEQIVFIVDLNSDIDTYCSKLIKDNHKKIQEAELIFINISLSSNYLEYFGIRLAYHLRLDKTSNYLKPIVFIGQESYYFIGKTCNLSDIIFTQNIYKIKDDVKSLEAFLNDFKKSTKNFDLDEFLANIHVQPPNNFESNHSIANEWAILRLFDCLKPLPTDNNYIQLKNQIDSLTFKDTLFFKFKESLINRQKFSSKKQQDIILFDAPKDFSVGIIDDEYGKGWYSLYKLVLEKSNTSVHIFDDFKKDVSKQALIGNVKKWIDLLIQKKKCYTFIIDLRLHDEDFLKSGFPDENALSGIEIYDYILSINPGIQIILITASNKLWNYSKLARLPVKNFIIKEDPSYELKRTESSNFFLQLHNAIKESTARVVLAEAYNLLEETKNFKGKYINDSVFDKKVFEKGGYLDQIFHTLYHGIGDPVILKQCLLICYQTIEYYCKHSKISEHHKDKNDNKNSLKVFDKSQNTHWIVLDNDAYFEYKYDTYHFQEGTENEKTNAYKIQQKKYLGDHLNDIDIIVGVLLQRHNFDSTSMELVLKFRFIRNTLIAHSSNKINESYKIDKGDIFNFIKLLKDIFS